MSTGVSRPAPVLRASRRRSTRRVPETWFGLLAGVLAGSSGVYLMPAPFLRERDDGWAFRRQLSVHGPPRTLPAKPGITLIERVARCGCDVHAASTARSIARASSGKTEAGSCCPGTTTQARTTAPLSDRDHDAAHAYRQLFNRIRPHDVSRECHEGALGPTVSGLSRFTKVAGFRARLTWRRLLFR